MDYPRPVYLRFGKKPMRDLHDPATTTFEVGRALTVRDGTDLTFISIGEPTSRALAAAEILEGEGISCRVTSMHTLRPFDTEALLAAATETNAIITVEEHSIYGGLGECCAGILMQRGIHIPLKIVGIPDEYTVTGGQFDIFDHYGISGEGLAATARTLLGAKV
jgi:transketolase